MSQRRAARLFGTNTKKAEIFEEWMRSGIKGFIWAEFFAHAKHLLEILRSRA